MARMLVTSLLTLTAILGVSALAFADETTIIEKRSEEHQAVEVAPPPRERVIEERTVTQPAPAVQKRTDTVVKTTKDNDNDDNDDDND
jgi:hypothetical protein